jgi:hypothetical protein
MILILVVRRDEIWPWVRLARRDNSVNVMSAEASSRRQLGASRLRRRQPRHRLDLSDALLAASMRDVGLAEPSVPSLFPTPASRADLLRPLPSLTDVRNRTPSADEELKCMLNHLMNRALLRPIETAAC